MTETEFSDSDLLKFITSKIKSLQNSSENSSPPLIQDAIKAEWSKIKEALESSNLPDGSREFLNFALKQHSLSASKNSKNSKDNDLPLNGRQIRKSWKYKQLIKAPGYHCQDTSLTVDTKELGFLDQLYLYRLNQIVKLMDEPEAMLLINTLTDFKKESEHRAENFFNDISSFLTIKRAELISRLPSSLASIEQRLLTFLGLNPQPKTVVRHGDSVIRLFTELEEFQQLQITPKSPDPPFVGAIDFDSRLTLSKQLLRLEPNSYKRHEIDFQWSLKRDNFVDALGDLELLYSHYRRYHKLINTIERLTERIKDQEEKEISHNIEQSRAKQRLEKTASQFKGASDKKSKLKLAFKNLIRISETSRLIQKRERQKTRVEESCNRLFQTLQNRQPSARKKQLLERYNFLSGSLLEIPSKIKILTEEFELALEQLEEQRVKYRIPIDRIPNELEEIQRAQYDFPLSAKILSEEIMVAQDKLTYYRKIKLKHRRNYRAASLKYTQARRALSKSKKQKSKAEESYVKTVSRLGLNDSTDKSPHPWWKIDRFFTIQDQLLTAAQELEYTFRNWVVLVVRNTKPLHLRDWIKSLNRAREGELADYHKNFFKTLSLVTPIISTTSTSFIRNLGRSPERRLGWCLIKSNYDNPDPGLLAAVNKSKGTIWIWE